MKMKTVKGFYRRKDKLEFVTESVTDLGNGMVKVKAIVVYKDNSKLILDCLEIKPRR